MTAIKMARECMKNTPCSMQEAVLFVSSDANKVYSAIEGYGERLLLNMHAMRQAEIDAKDADITELVEALQLFVDRVDGGEIRSTVTYAMFKGMIAKRRPDAFAKWPDGLID